MKPPARLTSFYASRLFTPRRCVAPLEVVAAFRDQTPAELAEQLAPALQLHELDAEADAEADYLRDLRLDEGYPLGAVPTCRDVRRGRTA